MNTMKQLNEAMQNIEEHLLEARFRNHWTENNLMNGGWNHDRL